MRRRRIDPPPLDAADDIERRRLANAAYQREWRSRQARGEIVLRVSVDHEYVALLLDSGEIDEDGSRDRTKLAAVIRRLAYDAASRKALR